MKLLVMVLALFVSTISFPTYAVVFGNHKTSSLYGDTVIIEIEVFNLYETEYQDLEFDLIDSVNIEAEGKSYPITFKQSFIQSNGLGWLTLFSNEKVYNGTLNFILGIGSSENKGKRKYSVTFFGPNENRPVKTCNIRSKRMKCVED